MRAALTPMYAMRSVDNPHHDVLTVVVSYTVAGSSAAAIASTHASNLKGSSFHRLRKTRMSSEPATVIGSTRRDVSERTRTLRTNGQSISTPKYGVSDGRDGREDILRTMCKMKQDNTSNMEFGDTNSVNPNQLTHQHVLTAIS